jgi:L-lactate dehydrogenase complex protein LldG
MNIARENILRRVRESLRAPAHRPLPATAAGPVFAPVAGLEARFREEFLALKGEVLGNASALREFLAGFERIATDQGDLAGQLVGAGNAEPRQADLGVTGCECLVAQTGSIVVTARAAGGRAVSVLPPVHLVLARRLQIVPDLDWAIKLLTDRYHGRWPSALSVITGPSRTADIEKILVLGAHGPKRLVLYFAE